MECHFENLVPKEWTDREHPNTAPKPTLGNVAAPVGAALVALAFDQRAAPEGGAGPAGTVLDAGRHSPTGEHAEVLAVVSLAAHGTARARAGRAHAAVGARGVGSGHALDEHSLAQVRWGPILKHPVGEHPKEPNSFAGETVQKYKAASRAETSQLPGIPTPEKSRNWPSPLPKRSAWQVT